MATPSPHRLTTIAAGLVLFLSCGTLGSYFYLKNKAQSAPTTDRLAPPDPKIVATTDAAKEARILKFRAQFETWAKAHQSEIRAMMLAQPNDSATWRKVSLALPSWPDKKHGGFDEDDFIDTGDTANPAKFSCEWSHIAVGAKAAKPELMEEVKKGEELVFRREEEAFKLNRDFPFAWVSSSWSKKHYALWVSGKVTCGDRDYIKLDPNAVTVAGSYDFLTGKH